MTTVTKSPTRESQPHPSEQSQPRRWNVYDYDGEYEFATARHWTAREAPTNHNSCRPAVSQDQEHEPKSKGQRPNNC